MSDFFRCFLCFFTLIVSSVFSASIPVLLFPFTGLAILYFWTFFIIVSFFMSFIIVYLKRCNVRFKVILYEMLISLFVSLVFLPQDSGDSPLVKIIIGDFPVFKDIIRGLVLYPF